MIWCNPYASNMTADCYSYHGYSIATIGACVSRLAYRCDSRERRSVWRRPSRRRAWYITILYIIIVLQWYIIIMCILMEVITPAETPLRGTRRPTRRVLGQTGQCAHTATREKHSVSSRPVKCLLTGKCKTRNGPVRCRNGCLEQMTAIIRNPIAWARILSLGSRSPCPKHE